MVEHVGQRLGAAAGVARPARAKALNARVAARRIDHAAPPRVVGVSLAHLLAIDQGIQVVHFLVVHAVAPFAIRVIHNLVGAIQLEAARALIDKFL